MLLPQLLQCCCCCCCCCLQDVLNLDILTSYHDQLYAAVCFSVINSVEKMFRCGQFSDSASAGHNTQPDRKESPCRIWHLLLADTCMQA